jgi:hypothetical protein
MENDSWPTQDETISTVADIIHKIVFEGAFGFHDPKEVSRKAAIAVINHLAGVYDEAMKNEPPDVG